MQKYPSIKVFGIPIHNITSETFFNDIRTHLRDSNETIVVMTPNPEILVAARSNTRLRNALQSANIRTPDGQGLILLTSLKERITGTDTMHALLQEAHKHRYTVGIVYNPGGLSQIADIQKAIHNTYSNCVVEVTENNFTSTPDIILVALGAPRQEYWIEHNAAKYKNTKIILTVGGGIDFLTNKQKRAPLFIRKIGLEWLWRLIKQPSRLQRIITATVIFPLYILADKFSTQS